MAVDIAPELLEKLQKAFEKKLEKIELQAKNYPGAFDYAEAVGTALAEVFAENLSGEELPDGKLYWNIANSVIKPMLERDHTLVSDAVVEVQTALNQAAGLGIKAQRPSLNSDKVSGILNRLASEESFDDVAWILREPVITFSMGVVDDGVRANAEFQSKAGLGVKIIRTMKGKGCAWCRALAGTYDYDEEPRDIYRRHDNCRCTVEIVSSRGRDVVHSGTEGKRRYVPDKYGGYEMTDEAKAARRREREATAAERAKVAREKRIATWAKKKQDVHAKSWTDDATPDKIEARKKVGVSKQREFRSEALLQSHFERHADEFGTISIPEYLLRANALVDRKLSDDVVSLLRSDGSTSKYCFSTNEFVVINKDGTIRTYFKPKDKEAYWQYELDRN